jgi:integrase
MPADFKMSWEPRGRRWWKQYCGTRYVVSCRQLNAPSTKESSYQAANAWWVAKKAEVDGRKPPNPFDSYLDNLSLRMAWARRHGQSAVAADLAEEIARIERGGLPSFVPEDPPILPEPPPPGSYDSEPPEDVYRMAIERDQRNRAIDPFDGVWNDRVAREHPASVPDDGRMGSLAKVWLSLKQAKVESGDISARGYDNTVDCLNYFRDWVGAEAAVTDIDEKRWQNYWLHLSGRVKGGVWSRDYATKVFRIARNFVEWSANMDLIPLPKNLHDREYRFGGAPQSVPTMTVDEVRMLVDGATGQLRLHLLLMANCGMTQKDVADLRQGEVDWKQGRIIRRRSKTADRYAVPTVNYKLWPLTWELLREYRASGEGERALLTLSGRPWVDARLVEGRLVSTDNIASNYAHLKRKLDFVKPLKLLRKTSASLLDEQPEFGRYTGYFLGHAPRSVRDKHYVSPSQDRFDDAVAWLGRRYRILADSD